MGQIFSSNPRRNDTVIIVIRPTGTGSAIINSVTRSGSFEMGRALSTVSAGEIRHARQTLRRHMVVEMSASPEETEGEPGQRTIMQRRLDKVAVDVQSLRSEIATMRVGAVVVDGEQIWTEMQRALDKLGHQIQRLRFELAIIRASATWTEMQEQLDNLARDAQRARSELAVKRSGPEAETHVSGEENMEEDAKGQEAPTSKSLKVDEGQFVHEHGGSLPDLKNEGPPQIPQPLPYDHLYPPYPPYFYPGYHGSPYHLAPPMPHCGISLRDISGSAISIGRGQSSNMFLNSDEQPELSGQSGPTNRNE